MEPSRDCDACPRLHAFVAAQRIAEPDWHNAPVPSFGLHDGALLIVGLAPGLRGANRTGRPFTGDYAGDLLYATLLEFGFATGAFEARPDDTLQLSNALITNAVRCVPPQNKPLPAEINTCRNFLVATMSGMPNLRAIVALGRVAHESVLRALQLRLAAYPFTHGAAHAVNQDGRALTLFDSYHCSRYNTNTGVLTTDMFRDVFRAVQKTLR